MGLAICGKHYLAGASRAPKFLETAGMSKGWHTLEQLALHVHDCKTKCSAPDTEGSRPEAPSPRHQTATDSCPPPSNPQPKFGCHPRRSAACGRQQPREEGDCPARRRDREAGSQPCSRGNRRRPRSAGRTPDPSGASGRSIRKRGDGSRRSRVRSGTLNRRSFRRGTGGNAARRPPCKSRRF